MRLTPSPNMNITLPQNSTSRASLRARFSVIHSVSVAALIFAAASSVFAQDDRRKRGGDNGGGAGGDRGNFNPQEMQAWMMTALRERFEVTNDEEWTVISYRITKVSELRRASGGGFGGMMTSGRGGPGGGDTSRGSTSGRSSRSGNSTDVAALQAAIQDKLPEAEIKARLDRVREQRKENEAKLVKAQEELRAVLSVRQEAIAVLAGLLQ